RTRVCRPTDGPRRRLPQPNMAAQPAPSPTLVPAAAPALPAAAEAQAAAEEIAALLQQIDALRKEQQLAQQAPAQQDEQTKKRLELQQKQIETLEKMVRLLADQLKKQPAGPAVEKLQTQTAILESRARQAAPPRVGLAPPIDDPVQPRG